MSEEQDSQEAPIISYSNRIQKAEDRLTYILSQTSDTLITVKPLRMMLRNFPPTGKKAFAEEIKKLADFESNTNSIQPMDVEDIYGRAHDWFYEHVLKDAFKFRPRNPNQAHISSGGGMRANE